MDFNNNINQEGNLDSNENQVEIELPQVQDHTAEEDFVRAYQTYGTVDEVHWTPITEDEPIAVLEGRDGLEVRGKNLNSKLTKEAS